MQRKIQFSNKYFKIPGESELGTDNTRKHTRFTYGCPRSLNQSETENVVLHYSGLCYIWVKQRGKERETELFESTRKYRWTLTS